MTNPYHTSEARSPVPAAEPSGYPTQPDAIPLYGTRFQNDPGQLYRKIRREYGPVAPVVLEGDVPAWLVLGYREVHQVSSNPQIFARDSRRWNAWDRIPPDWSLLPYTLYQPSVLFAEGAEHQRRAGVVSDALSAIDQFELRALSERMADRLIDTFAGRGEADLVGEYAWQVPLMVVGKLYGIADSEMPDIVHDVRLSLAEGEGEESFKAHQRTAARMAQLVHERRQRPRSDVPSSMVTHHAGLTEEEAAIDLLMVLVASLTPTAAWIGNALRLMLTDDRFAVNFAGGRSSIGQALNEVLWEDTPTQNFIGRWAAQDTQLGGKRIRKGDLVVLGLAAANGDPQVRPDSYAGPAGNHAQMSFGHGEHRCPYPAPEIAEVMAEVAIEVLLDRLPDVNLAVSPEALVWRPTVWHRTLLSLPVVFTAGSVAGRGAAFS